MENNEKPNTLIPFNTPIGLGAAASGSILDSRELETYNTPPNFGVAPLDWPSQIQQPLFPSGVTTPSSSGPYIVPLSSQTDVGAPHEIYLNRDNLTSSNSEGIIFQIKPVAKFIFSKAVIGIGLLSASNGAKDFIIWFKRFLE